jgi:inositol transport system substrate-binding protein
MKKLILAAAMAALMTSTAHATKVGVSMALFDDNFLTVLRNGIEAYAKENGIEVQIEDAQNDVAKQLDQIKNFAASGVDAIIVNPVDTSATQAMTDAASAAGKPLVYVNRQPANLDTLPDNQAFVASNEADSGTLETKEVCRLFKEAGKTEAKVYVIMGELSNQAAVQRTKDIDDVIATPDCSFIKIIDKQTSNWRRDEAQNLMTNWLSKGEAFDGVIANNDESAIGAIQAMKAGNVDMKAVVVGGVRVPGCEGPGPGCARCRGEARQGRSCRPESVDSLPAGDARQYRRLPEEELTTPANGAGSGARSAPLPDFTREMIGVALAFA